MANRYRRGDNENGQYAGDYARPRQSTPDSDSYVDFPPSLDQLTDNLELGKGQQEIWEEIYKLGVSGVDKYIQLPQIVVVGDQSSGKSSVLEAITGVPFPRNSGMCTKFPTQINLRKAPTSSFSVRLEPDLGHTEPDKARIARFGETIRGETDLGVIVKRAEQTIWPHGQSVNSASKDTLQLDFSGPKKDYLTLVDLPGIIHANASNIMSEEEVVAIRELAMEYMKNPRSIILCVISAANDLNLQMVATLARSIDPTGSRTLGVITKPDRIDSIESEDMFIKLAENKIIRFDLGWHVLRNRSNDKAEKNCSAKERDLNEKNFFETSRWNVLDKSDLGIDALKTKMSSLLLHRFAEVIPHVVLQIEQRLDSCKKSLKDLGEGFGDVSKMREKMQEWCKISADYVYSAAEGSYKDHYKIAFFDSEEHEARIRKLRARIDAANFQFEEELTKMGHSAEIIDIHPPSSNRKRSRAEGVRFPDRMSRAEFIEKRVDPIIRESAGKELVGDSNPLLVYRMFQKQSANWDAIAKRYMGAVSGMCESFLREVLDFVWPGTISDKIFAALIEERLERRNEEAHFEMQRLCKDRCRYAKSYDQDYVKLSKSWERKFMEVGAGTENPTLRPPTSAESYLAKLLAYYEVTLKIFMSNAMVQVVERHLVDDLEDIFDITRVYNMKDEAIEEIFAEDEHIRTSRAKLQAERSSLESGLRSAKRLAARKDLKVYDKAESDATEIESPRDKIAGLAKPTEAPFSAEGPKNPPLPSRSTTRRVETPRTEAEPSRVASARSSNPYYAPTQEPSTPVHQTGHGLDEPSPTRGSTSAQRPPPVPPYVPQGGRGERNIPGGYVSGVPDPYEDRRFVINPASRRDR